MDERNLILGGRIQKYIEIVEYFISEIKESKANLVFFARLSEVGLKHMDEYESNVDAFDCIKQYHNLRRFSNTNRGTRPNERFWYNLLQLCEKYGQINVHYWKHLRSIKRYIENNEGNILAIMTSEIKFLTLKYDFEYLSLSHVDFFDVKITKIYRKTLDNVLGLNTNQMRLLITLSHLAYSNDKCFEMQAFLRSLEGSDHPILKLSSYIKRQENNSDDFILRKISNNIAGGRLNRDLLRKFRNHFQHSSDPNDVFDEVQHKNYVAVKLANEGGRFETIFKFCSDKLFYAYKLMIEYRTIPKDLLVYIDVNQPDAISFIDLTVKVTLKLCGVLFKDVELERRPKTRIIEIRRSFNEVARTREDIIYPTSEYTKNCFRLKFPVNFSRLLQ